MHPSTLSRSARLPTRRIQVILVSTAVVISAAAHALAAATRPADPMAWWMAAMTVLCLACAAPMVMGRRCTSRAAEHLLGMGAAMILIHLAVLSLPGTGSHHGTAGGAGAAHGAGMLALLGVELLCLMLASTALRLSHHKPPSTQARMAAQPL